EKVRVPATPSITSVVQTGDRLLTKILVDAWILLSTGPLPQRNMSRATYERLSNLTLHGMLVCVAPMPKSDWLPGNNKFDYFAYVSLNSHDNTMLVAGEPAADKFAALNMLLWSIKARIALKSFITPRITTGLSYSKRNQQSLSVPALRRTLGCDVRTDTLQLLLRAKFPCERDVLAVRVNFRECQECCYCDECGD
ncbi:unnamed protein product, partial [Aureobasidium vineae]